MNDGGPDLPPAPWYPERLKGQLDGPYGAGDFSALNKAFLSLGAVLGVGSVGPRGFLEAEAHGTAGPITQGCSWTLQARVWSLLGAFPLSIQPANSLGNLGGWLQAWAACGWAGPPEGQGGPPAGSSARPLGLPGACGGDSGSPPGKVCGRRAVVSTPRSGAELRGS